MDDFIDGAGGTPMVCVHTACASLAGFRHSSNGISPDAGIGSRLRASRFAAAGEFGILPTSPWQGLILPSSLADCDSLRNLDARLKAGHGEILRQPWPASPPSPATTAATAAR